MDVAEIAQRAGQGALDWIQSLRIEHRDSAPCLGTESSCSGQHSAPLVEEALISFPTVFCFTSCASSTCCDKGCIRVLQAAVTFVLEQV